MLASKNQAARLSFSDRWTDRMLQAAEFEKLALILCFWKHQHKNDLCKVAERAAASELCTAQYENWWCGCCKDFVWIPGASDLVV